MASYFSICQVCRFFQNASGGGPIIATIHVRMLQIVTNSSCYSRISVSWDGSWLVRTKGVEDQFCDLITADDASTHPRSWFCLDDSSHNLQIELRSTRAAAAKWLPSTASCLFGYNANNFIRSAKTIWLFNSYWIASCKIRCCFSSHKAFTSNSFPVRALTAL